MRNFAVFILTHGRADRVYTHTQLRKQGYTGPIYLIIDNEDDQRAAYEANFGRENVIVFDKRKEAEETDTFDISKDYRVVVFARNATFRIAREMGLTHFLMLDDDYNYFGYRFIKPETGKLGIVIPKNVQPVFDAFMDFLDVSGALTVAMGQGGDLIGGANGAFKKALSRKAMNAFFCRTDRPFKFFGRINEDTNMYLIYGAKGYRIFSYMRFIINQKQTQSNAGGLTDIYLGMGTYYKSFLSVICAPSCVKLWMMGAKHRRIHHKIDWNKAVPKILNEKYRKRGGANSGKETDGEPERATAETDRPKAV